MMNSFIFALLVCCLFQELVLSYNGKLVVKSHYNILSNKLINNKISSKTKLQSWSPSQVIKKPKKQVLFSALINYVAATTVQWFLIVGFLHFLQLQVIYNLNNISIIGNKTYKFMNRDTISTAIVTIFMLFLSVRSRVFSPLNNQRPKILENDPVFKNRRRPNWQPAPKFFPIIWSTIAILRTISSVLIFKETENMLSLPILCICAHLSIGDTWNTINNVEQRLGTSFLGVWFVWGSVIATIYQYFQVLPLAGYILLPSGIWLSIAVALVYSIWRLNFENFNSPTLLPTVDEGPVSTWQIPILKWFLNK